MLAETPGLRPADSMPVSGVIRRCVLRRWAAVVVQASAQVWRVEWQIGRLLGAAEPGPTGWRSVTNDLTADQVYEFRLLATLDGSLPWDDMDAWARSRVRMFVRAGP